ncbi:hypothetical protein CEE45_11240 [Candidatus Heimdallarchaeota archaeon B3_Heim]|nr:MAG: hypothetical protein CEE45_11240 [Candidatus Heimdallarchaeota archaeon B3_Heim]
MVVVIISYRLLEDIAIADACFDLFGNSLEELFHAGFLALMETSVEIHTVKENVKKNITLEHRNLEQLLFGFLEELIFLKDAEFLIFKTCELSIDLNPESSLYTLSANVTGQEFNNEVSTITDVKAITFYQLFVRQNENGWEARVTFDL